MNFKIDEIWCSPLRRAVETAEILKRELKYHEIKIKLKPFLRERLSTTSSISCLYGKINNNAENGLDFSEMETFKKYWLLEEINNTHSEQILNEANTFDETVQRIYELLKAKIDGKSEGEKLDPCLFKKI
jgi:broad specificity phosphatase PhoE